MVNKTRLEAFTDAIVAIAATIMVLELHAPKGFTVRGLLAEWSVGLAYLVSFALIYVVWYYHQNAFKKAAIISSRTFLINGLWIFMVTLIPFVTSWVGDYPKRTLPEILYATVLLCWAASFQLLDWSIVRDNLAAQRDASNGFTRRLVLYGGFVLTIVVAFFAPVYSL
ncbi:TMEM175 family protein [Schleiferilactobacillus shenzhenensis]|nr:TMEM175 family protein [Schleiferilactobacillus shenzhenensis]